MTPGGRLVTDGDRNGFAADWTSPAIALPCRRWRGRASGRYPEIATGMAGLQGRAFAGRIPPSRAPGPGRSVTSVLVRASPQAEQLSVACNTCPHV